mgnify:CR=1 FL=1
MKRLLALVLLLIVGFRSDAHAQEQPNEKAPLPVGAVARLGALSDSFRGGAGALSPDGKLLALGTQNTVVFDVDSKKRIYSLKAPKEMLGGGHLVWSSDGRRLLVMDYMGRCMCWDTTTRQMLWPGQPPRQEGSSITFVRFVDGDRKIVFVNTLLPYQYTTGEFATGKQILRQHWSVSLRDAATGKLLEGRPPMNNPMLGQQLAALGEGYGICYVALSPSGERVAILASRPDSAAEGPSAVFVCETVSGKLLHTVKDLPRTYRIDMPDEGGSLVLYPPRPQSVETIVSHPFKVVGIPDGRTRMTGGYRYRPPVAMNGYDTLGASLVPAHSAVRFRESLLIFDGLGLVRWDEATGKQLEEMPFTHYPESPPITRSADGKRLAVNKSGWRMLQQTLSDAAPKGHESMPRVRFLPDGRLRSTTLRYAGPGETRIWDVKKATLLESFRLHAWPHTLFEGTQENEAGTVVAGVNEKEGSLLVYDQIQLKPLLNLKPEGLTREEINSRYRLIPSNDGKRVLMSGFVNNKIDARWYDLDGKELGRHTCIEAASDPSRPLWLADNGSMFGYVRTDHRLAIVDCATGKVKAIVGTAAKYDWYYSSAGLDRLLFARSSYAPKANHYRVWDRRFRTLRTFTVPRKKTEDDPERRLSHDGRTLAIWRNSEKTFAVKSIQLIETATGRVRGTIPVESAELSRDDVDFSPDGKLLAVSMRDTTILLWDLTRSWSGQAPLPAPANAEDAGRLWDLLGNPDPAESDRALRALVAAPDMALPLLKDRLRPVPGPDVDRVTALIKKLDSGNFKERDAANQELMRLSSTALPILEAAREKANIEQARRLDAVIAPLREHLEQPAAIMPHLRELRALEVLECIGTPAARKLIEAMARGADAIPTFEAQLILTRWAKTQR